MVVAVVEVTVEVATAAVVVVLLVALYETNTEALVEIPDVRGEQLSISW